MKKYKTIDLFCGCGGLSIGFGLTGRFESVLGWDNFAAALKTFSSANRHLGAQPAIVTRDIRRDTKKTLLRALKAAGVERGEIDCVVGGPPCEGFSQNRSLGSGGDWRIGGGQRVNMFIEDPRNQLFRNFLTVVEAIQPKVVLIENVPALVRHRAGGTLREIFELLRGLGYTGSARVLNSADYGVPQLRHRTFILAYRNSDKAASSINLEFPIPTHKPFHLATPALDDDESWLPGNSGYWTSVREAIGDLPVPHLSASKEATGSYSEPANSDLRAFVRANAACELENHVLRPLGPGGLKRVQAIKPRQTAHHLPAHLRPKSFFHYSYGRLIWSEPSRTITKFAYNVGSGMFAHPHEDRGITMREAARLQTFPDWVVFDKTRIRETSAMIGNAVPPLLAKKLGAAIAFYLDELTYQQTKHSTRYAGQAADAVITRMKKESFSIDAAPQYELV